MHPPRSSLATTTNPLVLVVLTWALLWGYGATQVPTPSHGRPSQGAAAAVADPLWEASWSRRFPGCVALALWPEEERPVAVVTRAPGGSVARQAPDEVRPAHGPVVGACR